MECYNIKSNEELKFVSNAKIFNIRISHIIIKNTTPSKLVEINPYVEFKVKNDLHGEIFNKKIYLSIVFEKMDDDNFNFIKIPLNKQLEFTKSVPKDFEQGKHTIEIKIGDESEDINYLVYLVKSFNINEY